MTQNPILDELHRTREALLANAGGTLTGLVAQLQQDERRSNRTVLGLTDLPRNRQTNDCQEVADRERSDCASSLPSR